MIGHLNGELREREQARPKEGLLAPSRRQEKDSQGMTRTGRGRGRKKVAVVLTSLSWRVCPCIVHNSSRVIYTWVHSPLGQAGMGDASGREGVVHALS